MIGLGLWTRALDKARRARLKTRRIKSNGMSLLSGKELSSSSGESPAVHSVQPDLAGFSDATSESDNDPVVESTVEKLSATGSDALVSVQKKKARSSGGISS